MKRNETLRQVIFRTMEFWLISSEKVVVGLRTEVVRPGFDRISWWGINVTRGYGNWEILRLKRSFI